MEDKYKPDEITLKAMSSKCVICNKKIRPWHLWIKTETKRGTVIFAHYNCIKK